MLYALFMGYNISRNIFSDIIKPCVLFLKCNVNIFFFERMAQQIKKKVLNVFCTNLHIFAI